MVQKKKWLHTNIHTQAEIKEETASGLPIISTEVYGRQELQGITEIKLHRQGTSNTGKNFLGSGKTDELGTERERERERARERTRVIWKKGMGEMHYTNPLSIHSMACLVVPKHQAWKKVVAYKKLYSQERNTGII